jgi:hypothetical protein
MWIVSIPDAGSVHVMQHRSLIMKRQLIMGVLAAAMGMGVAQGADDSIYGARMMTEQERANYQDTIRTMATERERDTYRAEHKAQIQARAREQGIKLNNAGEPVDKYGDLLPYRAQDLLQDQDGGMGGGKGRGAGAGGGGMGSGGGH